MRCFFWVPKTNVKINVYENINNFVLKIFAILTCAIPSMVQIPIFQCSMIQLLKKYHIQPTKHAVDITFWKFYTTFKIL